MLNNVTLMGRLTKDPELRYTTVNQVPYVLASIAVDRRAVQGREKETDFFNITAWQATAEFMNKHFTKGQPICVKGRLQQRVWTDNQGEKRYNVDVVAESVYFAGFKREDAQNSGADYAPDFDPYAESAAA